MESNKSLDEISIIAALLHDVQTSHGAVFNCRAERLTLNKIRSRPRAEGISFLTKTMPRLAKAFDKAIAGDTPLNARALGFDTMDNSELPRLLGEFFSRVLQSDGTLLQHPCADSVKVIRQLLFVFYKYELPYTHELEQTVIEKFTKTDRDLSSSDLQLNTCESLLENATYSSGRRLYSLGLQPTVARKAKDLLSRLFYAFSCTDITPRHGPGVVATKQRLWTKYQWSNVSQRIIDKWPLDAYFFASLSHVCDRLDDLQKITNLDLPAKVILVPKDSRGPRLISCEPVDFQWIQQGLGRAMVQLVERHPLTKWNVHFTDQGPNRYGALLGSRTGRYATLDLNEASDRVSLGLVRLLFPPHIYEYLEAARSSCTTLPDGQAIKLNKFAPMGSSLCFPVLALTVWAILTAAAPDADTREGILVYGDDVIVPTAYAADAIEQLESFGLKVNRDKSCIKGLFRESCGMDAFQGIDVTPVRFRTVWSSSPSPESYTSWISYANSLYDRKYFSTYDLIVSKLTHIYGSIPGEEHVGKRAPSLREVPVGQRPLQARSNKRLQKREYRVWTVKSPSIHKEIDGWSMLLRYFAEAARSNSSTSEDQADLPTPLRSEFTNSSEREAFAVCSYTSRNTSMLVRRWR